MKLQFAVKSILKDYPSLRAAGRALKIDHAYLWKLLHGIKKDPSADVLKKLGLEIVKEKETVYGYRTK